MQNWKKILYKWAIFFEKLTRLYGNNNYFLFNTNHINANIYPKCAPQLEHLFSVIIKQHKIPIGKKKIAQNIPKHVKLSLNTPTWHAGHLPIWITVGCDTITVCWGWGWGWTTKWTGWPAHKTTKTISLNYNYAQNYK